jgi:AraC-like DNA-binding protein
MLVYHEETHQICFCTLASFQALKHMENNLTFFIEQISEDILNSLIKEKKIDENTASDLFYSSKTLCTITDSTIGSYKQRWQDIYEMLRDEIG